MPTKHPSCRIPRRPAVFRPVLETLEDRVLLSTYTWTGAVDSSWKNAGNWKNGVVPPGSVTDDLYFPVEGQNRRNTDDLGNLTFHSIHFTGERVSESPGSPSPYSYVLASNFTVGLIDGIYDDSTPSTSSLVNDVEFNKILIRGDATSAAKFSQENGNGNLRIAGGEVDLNGHLLTLDNDLAPDKNNSLAMGTLEDPIIGSGVINKTGQGGWRLLTTSSTFTATITVAQGELSAFSPQALGSPDNPVFLDNASTLTLEHGELSNHLTLHGNATINAFQSTAIAGSIDTDLPRPPTLTLPGDGTLTGSIGGTAAGEGMLVIQQGTLTGTGMIAGTLEVEQGTLHPGVFLSPGSVGVGTLTVGALSFDSGTGFEATIDANGLNSEVKTTNGGVMLNGATLSISGDASAPDNQSFVLIDSAGSIVGRFRDPVSGQLLDEGASISRNGQPFRYMHYITSAAGGQVTLTSDPTPVNHIDTWTGGGGADTGWKNGKNWLDGVAPLPGDSLLFPGLMVANASSPLKKDLFQTLR